MNDFTVDVEREEDGRWIGEVPQLAGVLTYGASRDEAIAKAKALAFRVLADRLEHGEEIPEIEGVFAVQGLNWPSAKAPRVLAAASANRLVSQARDEWLASNHAAERVA